MMSICSITAPTVIQSVPSEIRWNQHLLCIECIRPAKAQSMAIIQVVMQYVRLLSARLASLVAYDSYMRASINLSRLMIHTCFNRVLDESKWGFTCIWQVIFVWHMSVLGDKRWEHSLHLGEIQRHVCEYTTESRCHLWLETTAHHPQALAWWTPALGGGGRLSGVRQLGPSMPPVFCLRQVTSDKRRQRLLCVAKQQDW